MLEVFNELTSLLCQTGHFADCLSWRTEVPESFGDIGCIWRWTLHPTFENHGSRHVQRKTDTIWFHSYVDPEKLTGTHGGGEGKKKRRLEWERTKA